MADPKGDPAGNKQPILSQPMLSTVYQELCSSYRATDDFRAKLLGFLPLASGAGIFLVLGPGVSDAKVAPFLLPIGLFGMGVTLGLFVLELRGIQKCHAFIQAGNKVEEWLPSAKAHFSQIPHELPISPYNLFLRKPEDREGFSKAAATIGTFMAARLIYATVFAGWMFVALFGLFKIICVLSIGGGLVPCGSSLHEVVAWAVGFTLLSFMAFFSIAGRYMGNKTVNT